MIQLPTSSLTEPAHSAALAGAVGWIEASLLGSVAFTISVLAVAAVGILLLSGRVEVRRGASVVLGAFIVFGSAQIAAGLSGLGRTPVDGRRPISTGAAPPAPLPPVATYDPYAGASFTPKD